MTALMTVSSTKATNTSMPKVERRGDFLGDSSSVLVSVTFLPTTFLGVRRVDVVDWVGIGRLAGSGVDSFID